MQYRQKWISVIVVIRPVFPDLVTYDGIDNNYCYVFIIAIIDVNIFASLLIIIDIKVHDIYILGFGIEIYSHRLTSCNKIFPRRVAHLLSHCVKSSIQYFASSNDTL